MCWQKQGEMLIAGHILKRQEMRAEWIKQHDLENLGQFKDETPLNNMEISSF